MQTKLNRKAVLKSAGGVGVAAVFGARALDLLGEEADAATTCLLTPEVTEGPYWIDGTLTRRNITEGKPGLPLVVRFTVVNAKTCVPLENADVEIWHCDAVGRYSGFESGGGSRPGGGAQAASTGTRYLRGHQTTNAKGKAEFLTVFPGWYSGRTPHIHMKVHIGGNAVHTGQVFFNERITAAVYAQAPYRSHGQYDTSHARDSIYRAAGGSTAELRLTKRAHGVKGYVGTIVIGVVT